jgi:transposase InsO family protein
MPAKRAIKALQKAQEQQEQGKQVKERVSTLEFYKEFGINAALKHGKISRATLYNWQKKYKENGTDGLIEGNRCPKHKRQSKIGQEIKEFIKEFRSRPYCNKASQYTIKPELDVFCQERKIKTLCYSQIARVIKELKNKGLINNSKTCSFNAKTGKVIERQKPKIKKERIGKYKPSKCGDLWQIDSVHLFEQGLKRYFINAIDIKSKFTFSQCYNSLNSSNAKDFFLKLYRVSPFEIRRIQTDNGSEFYSFFDDELKKKTIPHFWNYPRSPKSNAFIERFNRTFRQQFLEQYQFDFNDINSVNKNLVDYLLWYNTKKPHASLNFDTPLNYAINSLNLNPQKSNMLRDLTYC